MWSKSRRLDQKDRRSIDFRLFYAICNKPSFSGVFIRFFRPHAMSVRVSNMAADDISPEQIAGTVM